MTSRLRVDRRNLNKLKEKLLAPTSKPKVAKKLPSQRVAKERLAQFCEALFARIDAHVEPIDIPASTREIEPEDEVLAARVEALYKQLGEVSARVVRLREEVPSLVDKVVTRDLTEGSSAAVVAAVPSEVTVSAPLPARLKEGVERNFNELITTLTKLEQSYPTTVEKARRIKAVAEQRSTSRTEEVIQEELRATVASPRRTPKKTPSKRR